MSPLLTVPAEQRVIRNPFNMWTYLKHQPEQEHHSNTGNNICMVLDDKLMAENRRILVGLLSDPHVDAIRDTFAFARRRCGLSLPDSEGFFARERSELPLLPIATGPGWNWMACHSSASGRVHGESRRCACLTNESPYAQEGNSWSSLSLPRGLEYKDGWLFVSVISVWLKILEIMYQATASKQPVKVSLVP